MLPRIHNGKTIKNCSECDLLFYDKLHEKDICMHEDNLGKAIDWQDEIDPECPLPYNKD